MYEITQICAIMKPVHLITRWHRLPEQKTDSRYHLWHRKNRRPARKKLPASAVISRARPCVAHRSSLSKRCERHTASFWRRSLPSLPPPFAPFQKKENGALLTSLRT